MVAHSTIKNLLKILIGAAWIDGTIQPEERQYLRQVAEDNHLTNDPEIRPLLYELRAVSSQECYGWIRDYLGDHPKSEDYQRLLEAISGLIYSDGNVANEEAKLLSRIQLLDPATKSHDHIHSAVIRAIQKLYHKWVKEQN